MDLLLSILARTDLREDSRIKRIGASVVESINKQLSNEKGRRSMSYPNKRRMRMLINIFNEHPNRELIFGDDSD